jgi:hypothetical protein
MMYIIVMYSSTADSLQCQIVRAQIVSASELGYTEENRVVTFTTQYAYVCSLVCASIVEAVSASASGYEILTALSLTCEEYIPDTEGLKTLLGTSDVSEYSYMRYAFIHDT